MSTPLGVGLEEAESVARAVGRHSTAEALRYLSRHIDDPGTPAEWEVKTPPTRTSDLGLATQTFRPLARLVIGFG